MLSIQKPYKIRGSQVNLAFDPTSSYNCCWIPSLIGISRQKFFGLLYCFLNSYHKLQSRPIDDVCISRKSSQGNLRRADTYNTSASSAIPTVYMFRSIIASWTLPYMLQHRTYCRVFCRNTFLVHSLYMHCRHAFMHILYTVLTSLHYTTGSQYGPPPPPPEHSKESHTNEKKIGGVG
jgi:hypothetical protein